MSRWIVAQHLYTKKWLAYADEYEDYQPTTILDFDAPIARAFHTWREAMDYADRMARTAEVVLPRIAGCGDRVPGAPGLLLGWENHIFWLADHGSDFIRITPAELRPLAAALLALAEKEATK